MGGEAKNSLQGLERHLQVVVALLLRQLGELHQTRVLPLVVVSDLKQDRKVPWASPPVRHRQRPSNQQWGVRGKQTGGSNPS